MFTLHGKACANMIKIWLFMVFPNLFVATNIKCGKVPFSQCTLYRYIFKMNAVNQLNDSL